MHQQLVCGVACSIAEVVAGELNCRRRSRESTTRMLGVCLVRAMAHSCLSQHVCNTNVEKLNKNVAKGQYQKQLCGRRGALRAVD
jgi:hypothetical protein